MKIRITPTNLGRMVGNFETLVTKIPIIAKTSTKRIAEQILHDSLNVEPHCPQDSGALRSTARVEAVAEGHSVMYGGHSTVPTKKGTYDVDYANLVHDDLRPRVYKLSGSGPKFVETHVLRRGAEARETFDAYFKTTTDAIFRGT